MSSDQVDVAEMAVVTMENNNQSDQSLNHKPLSTTDSWVKFEDVENGNHGHVTNVPKQPIAKEEVEYATIEIATPVAISLQKNSNCESNSLGVVVSQPNAKDATNVTAAPNGFANGDIMVTLLPLNENCDWITPAKFKPHLVPEELMAQSLTLTVEDYVTTLGQLINDYRFQLYITLHKRVLALWISLSILILLTILFNSSAKSIATFIAGLVWLMCNALGIFLIIYIKHKLYRMLEQCVAQVNQSLSRHNIFVGVDDRGNFSCHKVNLIFVYFDPRYCMKFLHDMLQNNASTEQQATIHFDPLVDNADIVIKGSAGSKHISQKEKYAEKLLFRYSQRWVREYVRQNIELTQPLPVKPTPLPTTGPPNNQPNSQGNSLSNNQSTQQIPARHCRFAKCFCQYIEEHCKWKQHNHSKGFLDCLYP